MENKDYRAYLEPDEYVVWQGKPQKGNYFYREDIARIPFGAFFFIFAYDQKAIALTKEKHFVSYSVDK